MKNHNGDFVRAGGRRVMVIAALTGVLVAATACNDDQVKAIATNIDRVALLVQSGREVRDELFAQGIIDKDDAYKVTVGLFKVNTALVAFNNRARTYQSGAGLSPEGKALLKKLAEDISGAATELINNGTFGVKSPEAQAKLNAVIGSLRQATLAVVDAVDALKTKPAA